MRTGTLAAIALGLARTVDVADLEFPDERAGTRLAATAEYDAWLLFWPPGANVTPHDHGESAGAFTVVAGELTEIRWHRGLQRSRIAQPGDVIHVGAGVVHDVVATDAPAVSVHVYSPPLTSMGFYDEAGAALVDRQAVADARSLHPAGGG